MVYTHGVNTCTSAYCECSQSHRSLVTTEESAHERARAREGERSPERVHARERERERDRGPLSMSMMSPTSPYVMFPRIGK